jgi:hypothetical protein
MKENVEAFDFPAMHFPAMHLPVSISLAIDGHELPSLGAR